MTTSEKKDDRRVCVAGGARLGGAVSGGGHECGTGGKRKPCAFYRGKVCAHAR